MNKAHCDQLCRQYIPVRCAKNYERLQRNTRDYIT